MSAKKEDTPEVKQAAEVTEPIPTGEDYVTIQLFKDNGRYKDDVFVSVNGETCRIQRGIPVKIRRKFAEALENSLFQEKQTAQIIQGLSK